MKALRYTLAAAVVAAISLASCQDDAPRGGEGRVRICPKFSTSLTVESRADVSTQASLDESLIVWISNDKGVVRQYTGKSSLPDELPLLAGSYRVEAWAGDSVSASWDKRWFKGQANFDVTGGSTTDVEIKCKIANVAVRVEYANDVDDVLQDYTLEIGHSRGKLTFDIEHLNQRAYFMMPSRDKNLAWTLTGTKKADGTTIYTRTAVIANAQPGHEYVFKISCAKGDEPEVVGGAFLDIAIVDNVIEKDFSVAVDVNADPVVVNPVNRNDPRALSHNKATLTATVDDATAVGDNPTGTFYYTAAESRADEWSEAAADYADGKFSADITGLTPGTKYKYYFKVTSHEPPIVTNTMSFTTEPATQLPNSSFEDWQTASNPYLIYGEGQEMFWDSGNHGSKKAVKNVTVPDETIWHSGARSIRLDSQYAGLGGSFGKFAAGNVFVGKYLKTDGTDGILGFGRPFTGRPTALRVWVKYKPVAISHTTADAPDEYKQEGAIDKGAIFVALWDSYTEEYNGENFPIVIQTKAANRHLFDPQSEHIVAYGSVDLDETEGDGLVELTIPIVYRRTDVRPSYIILTCSASKAGDFFTGGSGSTMWLDDVELIYE